ncbi:MAG: general stress protein [Gemmataceae bacterium]|nr:general stress protein [Gemmataceae bacterium]
MASHEQISALIATFADCQQAEHYVEELRNAGFKGDEIGVLSPHDTHEDVEDQAVAGAITGGMFGALAGAVALGLIPGIGPVLAAGSLVGAAAAGAATGGLLGTLIGLGIPEERARRYEEEFLAGRTLVVVQALGRGGEALSILRRCQHRLEPSQRN